jgi:molybdenum cofactor cytidylyltransferase
MGTCKAALPWGKGFTLLSYQIEQWRQARFTPLVVLSAENSPMLERHCRHAVPLIHSHPEAGKTSSILRGLQAMPPEVEVIAISAVDQPRPSWIYQTLVQAHIDQDVLVTAPTHQQRLGHPLLFSHRAMPALAGISEVSLGLRQLIRQWRSDVQTIELDTAQVLLDINTPTEYQEGLHLTEEAADP